jgi:hypothetical protein
MKAYGGVDVQIHVFLTSALDGGEWSASSPWRFTCGEKPPVPTGQEAGWGPEQVWTKWRGEKPCPYRDSNSDPQFHAIKLGANWRQVASFVLVSPRSLTVTLVGTRLIHRTVLETVTAKANLFLCFIKHQAMHMYGVWTYRSILSNVMLKSYIFWDTASCIISQKIEHIFITVVGTLNLNNISS